jgi:hypothetical protein
LLNRTKHKKMKKLLLSLSAIAVFATGIKAQDFGFETWVDAAPPFITIDDPQGWASLNALTAVGTDTSVFKSTIGPAAGTASARIETVDVNGATIPNPYGGTLDTAGVLIVGKIVAAPSPSLKYGAAYANRPAVLSFQSKYTPMAGDSAFVLAYVTRWNGTSRDTLGWGKYATGATTMAYSMNSLTMTYDPSLMGVMADSQQIFISSSVYSHDGAKIGSTFYIDALSWSGYVSTNDIDGLANNVSVYPNPANTLVTIECSVDATAVEIMDVAGRKIGSYTMQSNKVSIETTGLAKGLYIYQVVDDNNKVLNRGKFEVAH